MLFTVSNTVIVYIRTILKVKAGHFLKSPYIGITKKSISHFAFFNSFLTEITPANNTKEADSTAAQSPLEVKGSFIKFVIPTPIYISSRVIITPHQISIEFIFCLITTLFILFSKKKQSAFHHLLRYCHSFRNKLPQTAIVQ